MHILLTNDDGVLAPGLAALANVFQKGHHVTILAPDRNWSASGHAKTMHRPLRVWDTELADGTPAMTTDGTPSDCVTLAISRLENKPIDAVVSGINPLANLGRDVTYSGTIAAAMEATISGLRGFAISLDAPKSFSGELDYSQAAEIARSLVEKITSFSKVEGVLYNINVPYLGLEEVKGVRITVQGESSYHDKVIRRKDPHGQGYYWIGGDRQSGKHDSGSDLGALVDGFVSVTPLQLDLTAHSSLQSIESWSLDL